MFTNIFLKNKYGLGSSIAMFIIFLCFLAAILLKKCIRVEGD